MCTDHTEQKERKRTKRRDKKKNPKMAMHGKGMKRFAGKPKKTS
jgi:hypothetical protein